MKNIVFNAESFSKALRYKRSVDLNKNEKEISDQLKIDIIEYKALESGAEDLIKAVSLESFIKCLDFIGKDPAIFITKYFEKGDTFTLPKGD